MRGIKKEEQVETTRKSGEDRSLGSVKGEYEKQLRTAIWPLGSVTRKNCDSFHHLQLNLHANSAPGLLRGKCPVMGTLQNILGGGKTGRGQNVCTNQSIRKQTPSYLEREQGRQAQQGRRKTQAWLPEADPQTVGSVPCPVLALAPSQKPRETSIEKSSKEIPGSGSGGTSTFIWNHASKDLCWTQKKVAVLGEPSKASDCVKLKCTIVQLVHKNFQKN
ncbi:PREDICTED: uncharacterized protein LOC106723647 isoform X2 [Myotis brandtii]|uniref:uncharacterized protein LOC106723647 isoform X2 n=1 Tax=Myotis brandtii TaxID=109478 RepID=UPI0007046D5F|nr:PREDICTED: uncharacterized protein LOC106723647 isoform X2 [Myotis brandtii]